MTNKEFYSDKLLATSLTNACINLHELVFDKPCQEKNCCDCEFSTVENVENWLNAEYEEPETPLLENGDSLQPGDWIMVKDPDNEVWVKKIFAYYYDGRFYCANDIAFFKNGLLVNRTKARLPEDGE